MTQFHSHDLARPDATIRYWAGGAADASPVAFLHGATLDHRAWHPQTDALLRHCLARRRGRVRRSGAGSVFCG
jgi:pimeloyl-ACP methyl ester carboxylesterase